MPENTEKPNWLQKLLAPIIDQILNRIGLEKRLDDLQAKGLAELEETRDKAFAELEQTRDQALAMVKTTMDGVVDSLPKMAAAVSEAAVTTVFDHTQIDETTDRVAGVFTNILDSLPFGIGRAPQ